MKRTDWPRVAAAFACLGGAVLVALAGRAAAQPAGRPASQPAAPALPAEAPGTDLNVNERGTVELHVQGADIRRVLQLLSTQSKTNIVATKDVQGTVTADLDVFSLKTIWR